jgi:mono/diheme cytochrome c family protein
MHRVVWTLLAFGFLAAAMPPRATGQTAEEGQKLFVAQKCGICHSIAGTGNKRGPLDDVGAKLTAAEIRAWILTPTDMAAKARATRKPPMKAYTTLPASSLDALVAYLLTLKPAS